MSLFISKMMKRLLIVGAGECGHVLKELAEDYGYKEIAFLDDNSLEAIGKVSDYPKYERQYDEYIVAVGNPHFRSKCVAMLKDTYAIATIIHDKAYVSKDAVLMPGCIVEPGVVVHRNAVVGESYILNAGAVINHDSKVGAYSQIGCNAFVPARTEVPEGTKVEHCTLFK